MAAAGIPWSDYLEKAAQIRNETGVLGLCSRLLHKAASPFIEWGSVTFFVRELDADVRPQVEVPRGVQFRRVPASEILALKDGGDPTQDVSELVRRYRRGDWAFAAIAGNGEAAHLRWVSTTRANIPELGRDFVLAPGQAYCYNAYTRADSRGRGFDGCMRAFVYQSLQAAGYREVFSYVRRSNPAGLRAASRWQRPIATFWYLRVGPFGPMVVSSRRSKRAIFALR